MNMLMIGKSFYFLRVRVVPEIMLSKRVGEGGEKQEERWRGRREGGTEEEREERSKRTDDTVSSEPCLCLCHLNK